MKTNSYRFQVDRREINYLRTTIESYDGMAVVETIEPYLALIQIHIAPGCEESVFELLDSLRKSEGISIIEKKEF